LIAFDSHGVHQASTALLVQQQGMGYIEYMTSVLGQTLADGAVFTSIESYNAYSFNAGGYTGNQGQVAQWLAAGGTAGVGTVEEPTASWVTITNENLMIQGLLNGMTFAEAAWSGTFQVSFVNTFVGDPLMTWRTLVYGDINRDGRVNISDLVVMSNHWGEDVSPGGYSWTLGDLNSDGTINISDLVVLSNHWGETAPWLGDSSSLSTLDGLSFDDALPMVFEPVPEPSTIALASLGLGALWAYRPLARRKMPRLRTTQVES
jgi:hypothetical protein